MILKHSRGKLLLCFVLGIAVFAAYETVTSFQASNCRIAASEPFVCSVVASLTEIRIFANQNEGFVVGFFTMLLVFVTGWLVRATLKLWRGAEDTAQRQLRAYLTSVYGGAGRQGMNKGYRFEFRPSVINTGQTPAYNVHTLTGIKFMTLKEAITFDFSLPYTPSPGGITLGPRQDRFSAVIFERRLTRQELQQYLAGTKIFFVYGTIHYRDAFQTKRFTNFCYSISWWNKRSAPMWLTTHFHNDSD